MTLYTDYRPTNFNQVIGQTPVVSSIHAQMLTGQHTHAYLMTGPRGTGKTTVARLIALYLNCLGSEKPCGECEHCQAIVSGDFPDVIEIDAATHSGVATIRELRNQAQFSPVQGNYKVYIIDECHQLSAGAANALLKTLEEPPDPIKFILATTEEYKVIPTIKSRCQVHRFGLVHKGLLVKHLKHILQAESQFLSDETIEVIAEEARGAVRDALSLLEMVLHLSDNSAENVRLAFGRASHEDVSGFMDLISDRNLAGAFAYCHDLQEKRRVDMKGFQIELIIWLRGLIHLLARSSVFEHAWVEKMREQAWAFSIEDLLMCVQVLQKQTYSIRFPTMALEMAAVEMCAGLPEVMDF